MRYTSVESGGDALAFSNGPIPILTVVTSPLRILRIAAVLLPVWGLATLLITARASTLDQLSVQPSAAYSFRQLGASYAGPAIRVRRSSDNTEQDIGFTAAGAVDLAALQGFAGGGDAFLTVWYDQSGNGANVSQATTANQPQVVVGGVLVSQGGRLALSSTSTSLLTGAVNSSGYTSYTKSTVLSILNAASGNCFFTTGPPAATGGATIWTNGTAYFQMWHRGALATSTVPYVAGSSVVLTALYDQPTHSSTMYQNGASVVTSTSTLTWSGNNTITLLNWNSNGLNGRMCEALLFGSKISDADRGALESSQTSYWVSAPASAPAPAAPTGVTLAASGSQYSLSWTPSGNVAGGLVVLYLVESKLSSSSTWATVATVSSPTVLVGGLTMGSSYDFRITPSIGATAGAASVSTFSIGVAATAPGTPGQFTVVPGNARAALNWAAPTNNGGSTITDYKIEYGLHGSGAWAAFSHAATTNTIAVVPGLTNGTGYDFRVSAVNSAGTSTPTATLSGTPAVKTFLQILCNGQSLSVGVMGTPAVTTTQPYDNVMLGNSPQGLTAPLIPLVEGGVLSSGTPCETHSSAMANALRAADGRPVEIGSHGVGGTAYSGLCKGTTPYANGMTQASVAKSYVESTLGCSYLPLAVTIVHGEADYKAGLSSSYEANLVQWQSDYQNDLAALTGTSVNVPLFTNQLDSANTGEMAVAQLQAHRDYPGKIYLTGPKYQYHYASDHVHLTNTSYRLMGEMFAKVIKKVMVDGTGWDPLMPISVIGSGTSLVVSYHIPVGSLVLDTTNVAKRPNYGFEFSQTGGNTVTVTSVQLINNNTQVQVGLSAAPTGTNPRLRYAWGYPSRTSQALIYQYGEASTATFCGGNIRDMDTSVSPASNGTGQPLYDWSVSFDDPVMPTPVVDLAVTTATAAEVGPVPGAFTLSRSGSTSFSLPVHYTVSGTATNGTDYVTLSGTATIPVGQSSTVISVTPLADGLAEGPETVVVTLAPDPTYTIGSGNGTVTIFDQPIDAWRFNQFGVDANTPSIAGNEANPTGDGVTNLMKYALGLNPLTIATGTSLPVVQMEGGDYLTISFSRPVSVIDVTYQIEVSGDLVNWSPGSSYSASGDVPSNANTTEVSNSTASGIQTIKVRDNATSASSSRRFIRLKVTNP